LLQNIPLYATDLPACLLTNTWNAVESELSSLMPKAPFVVEGCRVLQHQTWQDERSGKSGMSSMWQYYACLALLGVCVCVIFIAERAELYSSVLLFAKFRQWSWLPPKIKVRRTRF
jgi:hypothetical protein